MPRISMDPNGGRSRPWRLFAFFPVAAGVLAVVAMWSDQSLTAWVGRGIGVATVFLAVRAAVVTDVTSSEESAREHAQFRWVSATTLAVLALMVAGYYGPQRVSRTGSAGPTLLLLALVLQQLIIWVTYGSRVRRHGR